MRGEAMTYRKAITWMPENPYPENIFPDLDADSQSAVNFAISGLGLTPDRVFGSWGRQVWENLCREMEKRGETLTEGELVKNSVHCKECCCRLCCGVAKEAIAHELLRLLGGKK